MVMLSLTGWFLGKHNLDSINYSSLLCINVSCCIRYIPNEPVVDTSNILITFDQRIDKPMLLSYRIYQDNILTSGKQGEMGIVSSGHLALLIQKDCLQINESFKGEWLVVLLVLLLPLTCQSLSATWMREVAHSAVVGN